MLPELPDAWQAVVGEAWKEAALDSLRAFISTEYETKTVYPPIDLVFTSLRLTPPESVKAVILGQDPYHGAGQAHGLAFSVQPGVRPPPSLANIFKELKSDLGITVPAGVGTLTRWAHQGVLLLNAILTVRAAEPLSHKGKGWERFTDAILRAVSASSESKAFVLWGAHAQKKRELIDASRHTIIESVHPSPLSARAGFFGSKPFSRINEALKAAGRQPIDWTVG